MTGGRAGGVEAERGRVAAAHSRRLARDRAYRDAVRAASATAVPDGYHPSVAVAAGDSTDWLLDQADEAGGPVAVLAERGGELAVYRLERVV